MRVLPPLGGRLFQAVRYHTVKQFYPQFNPPFVCACKHDGGQWKGNCYLCNKYKADWQNLKRLKPWDRFFYNVVVAGEQEAKIFKVGLNIHTAIITAMIGTVTPSNQVKPLGDISDMLTGRWMTVTRKMVYAPNQVQYPDYRVEWEEPSLLGNWEAVLFNGLHDLTQFLKPTPEKDMIAAFEEEFGKPINGRRRPKAVYRSIDEEWQV